MKNSKILLQCFPHEKSNVAAKRDAESFLGRKNGMNINFNKTKTGNFMA